MLRHASLLACAAGAGAAALVPAFLGDLAHQLQQPLARIHDSVSGSPSDFQCNLPPPIDPAGNGLPSADDLFSSEVALGKQIERHLAIVRVPSVSFDDLGEPTQDPRWAPFHDLHKVLEVLYPSIHRRATLEKVNTLGLVYTIAGSDQTLKPVLLAAHQDVVPVADESTWTHPPFAAVYDGEYLWGRGASDDKNSLTALMSAVEALLDAGWAPTRTLVMAFGFDEECSGYRGAGAIAQHLTQRYGDDGVAIILDEGGLGLQLLGDDTLYALPAVVEKGHVDIWLDLSVVGGHSSIPFPHTSIGIAAEIIAALEANPYDPELLADSPVHRHLQCQARYSPQAQPEITRLVKAGDLDALAGELAAANPMTQFMIQTSQAVDMIDGGQKINAMPEHVALGVNYRVAPQNTIPEVQHNVVRHIQDVVAKYGLELRAYDGDDEYEAYLAETDPEALLTKPPHAAWEVDYKGTLVLEAREKSPGTPVSPTTGPVWDVFSGTIQHTFAFEDGTVVPVGQIMTGNTDTRHYLGLSSHVYRWTPNAQGGSINIHTIDERILMSEHMSIVKFYYNFVRNFDKVDI